MKSLYNSFEIYNVPLELKLHYCVNINKIVPRESLFEHINIVPRVGSGSGRIG